MCYCRALIMHLWRRLTRWTHISVEGQYPTSRQTPQGHSVWTGVFLRISWRRQSFMRIGSLNRNWTSGRTKRTHLRLFSCRVKSRKLSSISSRLMILHILNQSRRFSYKQRSLLSRKVHHVGQEGWLAWRQLIINLRQLWWLTLPIGLSNHWS